MENHLLYSMHKIPVSFKFSGLCIWTFSSNQTAGFQMRFLLQSVLCTTTTNVMIWILKYPYVSGEPLQLKLGLELS